MNRNQPIDLYRNKRIEIENLYPIQLSNYVRVIFGKSKTRLFYSLSFILFLALLRNRLKFLLLLYMDPLEKKSDEENRCCIVPSPPPSIIAAPIEVFCELANVNDRP